MKNLYLIRGIKRYPGFTGDTTEEYLSVIAPGEDSSDAILKVSNNLDEVIETMLLYRNENDEFADIIYIV